MAEQVFEDMERAYRWLREPQRGLGGRWDARGTPMVYLGGSLSLAALEIFMHLGSGDDRLAFIAIPIQVPDDIAIEVLGQAELPPGLA